MPNYTATYRSEYDEYEVSFETRDRKLFDKVVAFCSELVKEDPGGQKLGALVKTVGEEAPELAVVDSATNCPNEHRCITCPYSEVLQAVTSPFDDVYYCRLQERCVPTQS